MGHEKEKELEQSLFSDGMIVYAESHKEFTSKLSELINEMTE